MNLPRLVLEGQKDVLSPTTLTWQYFASMKILNKIACALQDSTMCYNCFYFISFLIPFFEDWMLWKKLVRIYIKHFPQKSNWKKINKYPSKGKKY
jgi:hypothetical protein